MEIHLPDMHKKQLEVARHKARFKVLSAGRRWRKSSLGVTLCVTEAVNGGYSWWVAPSYKVASVGWRMLKGLCNQIPNVQIKEVDRMVLFQSGGFVQVRSADDPNSLRGEGLNFVVLDEAAFMKEAAWSEALRPSLSDKKGSALFISTPNGRNWFYNLFVKARDPEEHDWQAWQFPTETNPYIDPKEIEIARNDLPEQHFLQEYMAEFIEDAGLVFRKISEAATAVPKDYPSQHRACVFGADWGKHMDFTVITVMDTLDKAMLHIDRFNKIDYHFQAQRLKALARQYKPVAIIAEANAMGEPVIEQLIRDELPVEPFITTNATKKVVIEALALAFEQGQIKILKDEQLINELQAFQAERLPSGLIRYSAPEGLHDDCVISLALAWQGIITSSATGEVFSAPSIAAGGQW